MAAVIALLGRMLTWLVATNIGQWVLKGAVALGLTVAVHKVAFPSLLAFVQSYANGLPPVAYQAFGACGFDVFMSMLLSAVVTRATGSMVLRRVTSA